jgi:signal transduction histidine kinase
MLRGRFVRSGQIEELGMWLGAAEGGRPTLRDALARALGDESVELVFWLPDGGRYVDATGFSFPLPRTGSDRGVVEVESSGELVGAIIYDAVLIAEPELVRAAGRVIALALERERLTAELRASRDAVRESRARIVEAADRERRQIAQDLHDGLQGRLVLLGIQAAQLEQAGSDPEVRAAADGLRGGLEAAAAELRGLVQGVMPSLLIERGLYAATADLVDRLPVPTRLELSGGEEPLPDEVQRTGYFVVAEALTNAVKHSRARELAVCVGRVNGHLAITVRDNGIGGAALTGGSGLRGIADRLDVLGGRLRVESELGHGTVITAEVPCGL